MSGISEAACKILPTAQNAHKHHRNRRMKCHRAALLLAMRFKKSS
jgi:hypothetical protein